MVDDFEVFEKPEKPKKTSKNKTHKCKICSKILSSQGNLNKHMIIHDPSKQFECSECQAKFNQVSLQNLLKCGNFLISSDFVKNSRITIFSTLKFYFFGKFFKRNSILHSNW